MIPSIVRSANPFSRIGRKGLTRLAVFGTVGVLGACAVGQPGSGRDGAGIDSQHLAWDNYGGGPDASKFVAFTQITKDNVGQLEVAWEYETEDNSSYSFNPIVVDGTMYVVAKNRSIVALNAETGEELWIHARLGNIPTRGLNFWQSADGTEKRILFVTNNYLQALDAETGQSVLSFGENGLVDLKEGVSGRDPDSFGGVQSSTPGVVFGDLVIVGSAPGENFINAPGHIRAYNAQTGAHAWTFHTVPQPGEFGYETWPPDAYKYIGGTNVWGEFSVDVERGIVYAPTGSPNQDFYGADRIGANLFGNTLLALDARTGERIWHFQATPHDLRDYDLNSAPQLVTVNHDGEEIPAVVLATKMGMMFAFNRVTGEPLWPIEDRPIPQSTVPGEQSWPTAPFQPHLEPFSRQTMTSADVSPFLPEERREALIARIDTLVANDRMGLYTPLSHEHATLAIPGTVGGANFGHTASDPYRGLVYVISNDGFSIYEPLIRHEPPDPNAPPPAAPQGFGGGPGGFGGGGVSASEVAQGETLYAQQCQMCHLANRVGVGAAPSLIGVETRMSQVDFSSFVRTGRGEMPGFGHLTDDNIQALYRFLGGSADGGVIPLPEGAVVASGGAPGGLLPRESPGGGGRGYGLPYPEGVDVPEVRYVFQGYGMQYPAMSPPWSSITAYDMNTGTIKWTRPLGTYRDAAEAGVFNTGVPETLRNGMVVTATGLVFSNAKDGTVYAFDADTGDQLWAMELPGNIGSEGIPAMYEVNGKQYLVVTVTTPHQGYRAETTDPAPPRRYVAFALPD